MTASDPAGAPVPEDLAEIERAQQQAADRRGARLVVGTAQVLEGLLALGILEHVRGPERLLEAMLPDLEPGTARDAAFFLAGAMAGTAAGIRKGRPRWGSSGRDLADAAEALLDAGYEAMGGLVRRAADATTGREGAGR